MSHNTYQEELTDDDISLSSSRLEENSSVEALSYADVPQLYTRQQAARDEELRRRKTREEEILDDEEYLENNFNEREIDDELTLNQNIGLYLIKSSQDVMGGRHLSVGLDQKPDLEGLTESSEDVPQKLERRRSSFVENLRRVSTFSQKRKFHIWDDELKKDRIGMLTGFLLNYMALGAGFMIVLAIYWGSLYHRNYRYPNMRMLVVLDDQPIGSLLPLIGETVGQVAQMDSVKAYGGWNVFNHTAFSNIAKRHNNTITQEVHRQIHHKNYWAAIYVKENATLNLLEKITNENSSVDTGTLIEAIFESGRDPILISTYISNFIFVFESLFLKLASRTVYPNLLSRLSPQQISSINADSLTDLLTFNSLDGLPITNPVIFAPLQLGLVYIVVFAFFQFLLSIRVHLYVATRVKGSKYILFRMITSHVAYLVLSLAYSTLNAAYGLNYRATFGNSGFLVMWSVGYLAIASLGSVNENMALLIFTFFKPLIGLWIIFLMVSNVTPTFSPMALCPVFYRYGYALPIHNSYELFKVIFFDGYKGQIGRNFGVLIAWIIASNLALPFTLRYVAKVNKRNLEKEAAAKVLLKQRRDSEMSKEGSGN